MHYRCCLPLIVVMALLGCRSEDEGKTVLKFAHSVTSGSTKAIYDAVVDEFEALHPDVKIKQVVMDGPTYEKQGLQSMLQGGDPPDVFFEWAGQRLASKVRDGYVADLTEVLNRDNWRAAFHKNSWNATRIDGRDYMIPNAIMVTVIHWYNTKILAEHGLAEPKTYEELVDVMAKLKADGRTPILFGNRELWPMGNWGAHLIQRVAGHQLYDDVLSLKPATTFTHPGFVQGLKLVQDWAERGLIPDSAMALSEIDAQLSFFNGRCTFYAMGNWLVSIAQTDAPPDFEYKGIKLPPLTDGRGDQTSIMALNTGYVISRSTRHFDLAVSFLKHMMSEDVQRRMVAAGVITTIKSAFDTQISDPHLRQAWEAWASAKTIVAPPDTGYRLDVANHLYDAIALVADGKAGPAEALERTEKQVAPWRQAAGEKGQP